MARLRKALGTIGLAADLWAAFQLFSIPSVLSVVTFISGLTAGGLHWAIFAATGVFAFCMIVVVQGQTAYRANKIFKSLVPYRGVLAGNTTIGNNNTIGITMSVELANLSQKNIYVSVKRITHQIAGRTPNQSHNMPAHLMISPGRPFILYLPTVLDVPVGIQSSGKVEVEIYYGAVPDRMKYLLSFEGIPRVFPSPDGTNRVDFLCAFNKVSHQRAH